MNDLVGVSQGQMAKPPVASAASLLPKKSPMETAMSSFCCGLGESKARNNIFQVVTGSQA